MDLIVQKNCLELTHQENSMYQIFDLKGSTYKREELCLESTEFYGDIECNPELYKKLKKNTQTLKDLDFMILTKDFRDTFGVNITES